MLSQSYQCHFYQCILGKTDYIYINLILVSTMFAFTQSITQVNFQHEQSTPNRYRNANNDSPFHQTEKNGKNQEPSQRWQNSKGKNVNQMKNSDYIFEEEANVAFYLPGQNIGPLERKEQISEISQIILLRNQLQEKDAKIVRLQETIRNLQSLPKNPQAFTKQKDLGEERGSSVTKAKSLKLSVDEQTRVSKKLKEYINKCKVLQQEKKDLQSNIDSLRIKIERQFKEFYEPAIRQLMLSLQLEKQRNLYEMQEKNKEIQNYEKSLKQKGKEEKTPSMKKIESTNGTVSYDFEELKQKNMKLSQQNQRLKKQALQLQKLNQQLDQQLKRIKEERAVSKRENDELQDKIKIIQKELDLSQSRVNINLDNSASSEDTTKEYILNITKTSEKRLSEIMKLEEDIRNLTSQNARIKKQAQEASLMYKQVKKEYEGSTKKWKSEQQVLQKKLSKKEQEIKGLNTNNETLQAKITTSEQNLQKGIKENERLNKAFEALTVEFSQLRRTKDRLQLQLENQAKEKSALTKKIEGDKQKLEKEKNALKGIITQLQKEKKALQDKIKLDKELSDRDLKQQREKIAKLQEKIKELELKIKNLQQGIKTLEEKNKKMQEKVEDLEQQNDRLSNELSSYKQETSKLLKFKKLVKEEMAEVQRELSMRIIEKTQLDSRIFKEVVLSIAKIKYFNDSVILSKMESQKSLFLAYQLKRFMGVNQFRPELVYRFDILNTVNFHSYFDKKKNLLAIIELKNGTVIGGFTESPFDQNITLRPGNGFIFSVTDEQVYRMRHQPRVPVNSYDTYYFLLGNAEIRLKSQQKKVFSNFGIANSTFDNAGDPRTKFLKTNQMTDNELQIETYEFYELKLNI